MSVQDTDDLKRVEGAEAFATESGLDIGTATMVCDKISNIEKISGRRPLVAVLDDDGWLIDAWEDDYGQTGQILVCEEIEPHSDKSWIAKGARFVRNSGLETVEQDTEEYPRDSGTTFLVRSECSIYRVE